MEIHVTGEEMMKRLGAKLGTAVAGGDCIELIGDVGAGKTTFTKGLAVGMGITETIQSPTFTINRTYAAPGGLHLSHYDFYRLSDPGIMADELTESLEAADTVIVLEWGDIVGSVLPSDHLGITITSPTATERIVTLHAWGARSERLIGALI